MQRLLIGWILFGLSLGFTTQSWAGAESQEFVLQNAVVATANGASMPVTKYTTVALDVTIATTATVTFEGSVSGDAWTSIACTAINTGVTTTAPTATGLYQCNVAGLSAFRARVSSWTAGAVTVYARATTAETDGIFALLASVFDSVNTALRVTLATLISGEDQTNNLLMTSGGVVRQTQILGTGGVPSTATDATTTPQILPTGRKTFTGRITCTGACVQTQKIYGTWRSTADNTLDDLVCTIVLNKATADQASCIPTETNFSYWYVTTTLTSGTTPLAGIFVQY